MSSDDKRLRVRGEPDVSRSGERVEIQDPAKLALGFSEAPGGFQNPGEGENNVGIVRILLLRHEQQLLSLLELLGRDQRVREFGHQEWI